MFGATCTVALWALSSIASAQSAKRLGAEVGNRWRLVVALVLFAVLAASWGVLPQGEAAWWFLASGAFGLGFGDLFMFAAYRHQGARITVLTLQTGAVPVAALAAWASLGETLSLAEIGLCIVIPAGVALAVLPSLRGQLRLAGVLRGMPHAIASAVVFGLTSVLNRHAFALADTAGTPLRSLAGSFGTGLLRLSGGLAFVLLLWCVLTAWRRRHGIATPPADWRSGWPWLLVAGLLGPGLGVITYQWGLAHAEAGPVHAILSLTPVAVIPLAWLSEGDHPSMLSCLGAGIAVAGAIAMALVHC